MYIKLPNTIIEIIKHNRNTSGPISKKQKRQLRRAYYRGIDIGLGISWGWEWEEDHFHTQMGFIVRRSDYI